MGITASSPGLSYLRMTYLYLYSCQIAQHPPWGLTWVPQHPPALGCHLGHHSIMSWALTNMPRQPPLGSYLCDITCSLGLSPGLLQCHRFVPLQPSLPIRHPSSLESLHNLCQHVSQTSACSHPFVGFHCDLPAHLLCDVMPFRLLTEMPTLAVSPVCSCFVPPCCLFNFPDP